MRQGLSRTGRSAGARPGDVRVKVVSGNNLQDDRIVDKGLDDVLIELNPQTEKHLLRPYDVVVTGKSTALKAAYVPSILGRAIANSTMVVVRPDDADLGLYLWWFITSAQGREMVQSIMVPSATLWSLPPRGLAGLEVPLPPRAHLRMLAALIGESERAYWTAKEAADIRRGTLRDHIVGKLLGNGQPASGEESNDAD